MQKEPETIEVEVVEIDGITPVPVSHPHPEEEDPRQRGWNDWQSWQGRARQLDMRWWPLWVLLGIVLVFLLLTVGVVLGVIFLIYRIIRGFFAGIAGAFRG